MELLDKMLALSREGFYCGQIMLLLALEEDGEENEPLIRAMSGLSGGLGFTGNICGALTGGVCLIGYYAGKGSAEEPPSSELNAMIKEYIDWFEAGFGEKNCFALLSGDMKRQLTVCPNIIESSIEKIHELLSDHGVV